MFEHKSFTGISDVDGNDIFIGDKIIQTNFNGSCYEAVYEVVIDPLDNNIALKLLKGNSLALKIEGLRSFGEFKDNKLKKGRLLINYSDYGKP